MIQIEKIYYKFSNVAREITYRDKTNEYVTMTEKHKPNGMLSKIIFRSGSDIHRDNGPAMIFYLTGRIRKECFYKYGKLNDKDNPSIIHKHTNGEISQKTFFIDGKVSRENNPAIITYK